MPGMDINPNTIFISNRDRDPDKVDPEGRKRRLCSIWKRSADGRYLEKDQAPVGYRTPNGLVWGHTIDELCLIERDPGLPIFTQYSRSQLKELGENYDDVEWDDTSLVRPRVKRPWPVLKLPKHHPANTCPPVGAIDGGCDEEHDEDCTYTIRWDEFSDDRRGKTTPRAGQPPPVCSTDPANPCTEGKKKTTDAPGLDCLEDLPKLEEFIPEGLFPDFLLVHDPTRRTNHTQSRSKPIKYKRLFPAFPRDLTKAVKGRPMTELTAHLHLDKSSRLGTGNHSYVYRALLTLPPPLSARSHTGQCTVAAKLAFPQCSAHTLLANEGKVYSKLPRHTQEEYCGFNIVPPCNYPVPVGAIAPKFYGYYVPMEEDGTVMQAYSEEKRRHRGCDGSRPCKVEWVSPILLMEECGTPVKPEKFTADERCVTPSSLSFSCSPSLSLSIYLLELDR